MQKYHPKNWFSFMEHESNLFYSMAAGFFNLVFRNI